MKGIILFILLAMPSITFATDRHFNNVQKIVVQDKFVDLRVSDLYRVYGVPVTDFGYDYYYKVISDAERERLAEQIAQRVFEKLVELEGAVPPTAPTLPNGPEPAPTSPTTPSVPNPNNPDEVTRNKVIQLFKVNCATCHTGSKAKSGFEIFGDDGNLVKLTLDQKWNIFDRIDGSNLDKELIMPKNGKPLEQQEVDLVREWVRNHK